MGFPRQDYWSGLPFPSSGELPNPGIEPTSPELAGRSFTTEPPGKDRIEASNLCKKILNLFLKTQMYSILQSL